MDNYLHSLIYRDLFKGFNENNVKEIFSCFDFHKKQYKKGEMILDESTKRYIGFILSGTIEIAYISSNGDKHIINRLSEGNIFGEFSALSDRIMIQETATALKDTVVIKIFVDSNFYPCKKNCDFHLLFIKNLMRILANEAMQLNEKINYLQIKSLRGRLCTYFYNIYIKSSNTCLKLPYNRNELANFLNVSRPSMSRELSRMKSDGFINYSGKHIELLNLEEITKYVQ